MIIFLLAFVLYQLLFITLSPIVFIVIACLQIRRDTIHNLRHRLGFVPATPYGKKIVWIHAVSVGEALATQEFIALIKREQPQTLCYMTIGTAMGYSMAKKNVHADFFAFLPFDFLPCMLLAYHRIKPTTLIIVEADLWPNLISLAKLKNIPHFLLNARISKNSEPRIKYLQPLVMQLYTCFTHIFTQSSRDTQLFANIGVPAKKITTLGNIKAFNVVQKRNQTKRDAHQVAATVLLAGSIHPTEDAIYFKLFKSLKPEFPDLKLILLPRHFRWQEELRSAIIATKYPYVFWTEQDQTTPSIAATLAKHDILAVCQMGKLFELYQHASIFYLGGTFVPVGGHNLLEPAAWGVPSFIGPHHANCLDTLQSLMACDAAISVQNDQELIIKTRVLLTNPAKLQVMRTQNSIWIEQEAQRVEIVLRKHVLQRLQVV